ncbi:DNA mismatch repair protein MutS [Streptomyces sp. GZWMJZ-114]|uniref:MutS-related protein n=1 Tax=Streptomyces sp. GZWMJZ-114 TaxID=2494734 RepID=UPI0010117AD9|nr:DNA mismatch repair protein MutS [Streptomyces sp. GZWMJZ-114]
MKVLLLGPDADFPWDEPPTVTAQDLLRDLGLDTLVDAMATSGTLPADDIRHVLLTPLADPDAVRYRQQVLQDCLEHPDLLEGLRATALAALDDEHSVWPGLAPTAARVLAHAADVLRVMTGHLRTLRQLAEEYAALVRSPGLRQLLGTLRSALDDSWFRAVEKHLERLRFSKGVTLGARLGTDLKGTDYVLRVPHRKTGLRAHLLSQENAYTYRVPARDENAATELAALRDRGTVLAAEALDTATRHIHDFLMALGRETSFYLAAAHLHDRLTKAGLPACFPVITAHPRPAFGCRDVYDPCLALTGSTTVVGNDIQADGTLLITVTGANAGGKTTLLRAIGLAQLMAQAGLFVAASELTTDTRDTVLTHFRREEDTTMKSGKLDEELVRMDTLVEQLSPNGLVLLNEPFAATTEREGAEVARKIIDAFVHAGVKVVLVTHLHELARSLQKRYAPPRALFLRADREATGRRSYKILPGDPRPTAYASDLYAEIFGTTRPATRRDS